MNAQKLSLAALARQWGWKPAQLYRLCASGSIPHARVNGRIYFDAEEVEAWFHAQKVNAPAPEPPRPSRSRADERAAFGIVAEARFS